MSMSARERARWVMQMVVNINEDHGVPLEIDRSSEGLRFKLRGRLISERIKGGSGAGVWLNGFTEALDARNPEIRELQEQNQNFRAANEAKHREIADMDRRHVDAVCDLRKGKDYAFEELLKVRRLLALCSTLDEFQALQREEGAVITGPRG